MVDAHLDLWKSSDGKTFWNGVKQSVMRYNLLVANWHLSKMDSFYIHLESNASTKNFQSNTITNFRNEIVPALELENNCYECALVDVGYVYSEPEISHTSRLYTVSSVKSFMVSGNQSCPLSRQLYDGVFGLQSGSSLYQPAYVKNTKFRKLLPES